MIDPFLQVGHETIGSLLYLDALTLGGSWMFIFLLAVGLELLVINYE